MAKIEERQEAALTVLQLVFGYGQKSDRKLAEFFRYVKIVNMRI